MSLSSSWSGGVASSSVVDVEQRVDRLDRGAHGARRVLERDVLAGAQRLLRHPADASPRSGGPPSAGRRRRRSSRRGRRRGRRRAGRVTESGGTAALERPVERLDRDDRSCASRRAARRPRRPRAACRRRPGPRSGARRGRRPRAGSPTARAAAAGPRRGRSRRRPARGARAAAARRTSPAVAALDDVVAVQRGDRERARVLDAELRRPARRTRASISRKRASSQSTRSILLTAATRWRMPSSDESAAWRRDCSMIPWRASIRITARCAVDAPVTMLRV